MGAYGNFNIGLGLVIITGGIDLSVGSMFALLGVLLSIMLTEWSWPGASKGKAANASHIRRLHLTTIVMRRA